MAKNDNLKDFLTDVADAIREKKGTTDLINPQDFSDEIRTLPSGEEVNTFGEVMTSDGEGLPGIKHIIVSDGVTSLAQNFLTNASSVISITIPDSVMSIGNLAFQSCSSLTTINFPENSKLTSIGYNTFYGCKSLININIPEGVVNIPSNAFANCTSLININIPEGVVNIYANAFMNCGSLQKFDFSKSTFIPTLDNVNAFTGTTCKMVVPDALYDEWIVATNWATYADRIVKSSEYTE